MKDFGILLLAKMIPSHDRKQKCTSRYFVVSAFEIPFEYWRYQKAYQDEILLLFAE